MKQSQRNSILCPNCRKLISQDESFCPHCGISSPGAAWKSWSILFFKHPENLMRFILWTNVGIYIISLLISFNSIRLNLNPFYLLSPDPNSLALLGATGTAIIDNGKQWWTLLSANYLHGSILHIFFNMMALNQLAPIVMREYGVNRTFVIYTLGGVGGFFISYLAEVKFTIGASASICALIGALLYYGKSRSGTYGQTIYRQVLGWAMGIFIFGLLVQGINNWGHGGGMLVGAALGFFLSYQERRRENLFHRVAAIICLGLTLAALLWSIVRTAMVIVAFWGG